MRNYQDYVPYAIVAFIGLIVFLAIVRRIFVNVGAREIAIKERRYFGAKMPPGRVIATEGEVGIQADVLKPGLHLIKWPFEKVVQKFPLIEIGPDELGIIEAIDGDPIGIDAGMIFGTGFAPFRGGPLHYKATLGPPGTPAAAAAE